MLLIYFKHTIPVKFYQNFAVRNFFFFVFYIRYFSKTKHYPLTNFHVVKNSTKKLLFLRAPYRYKVGKIQLIQHMWFVFSQISIPLNTPELPQLTADDFQIYSDIIFTESEDIWTTPFFDRDRTNLVFVTKITAFLLLFCYVLSHIVFMICGRQKSYEILSDFLVNVFIHAAQYS